LEPNGVHDTVTKAGSLVQAAFESVVTEGRLPKLYEGLLRRDEQDGTFRSDEQTVSEAVAPELRRYRQTMRETAQSK